MTWKQRRGRRTFGLASILLVALAAIGLASCSAPGTTLTSSVTLVPIRPGEVSNVGYYVFYGTGQSNAQIRFTSGTGLSVTVQSYDFYDGHLLGDAVTAADTGPAAAWTTVPSIQGVPGPPGYLTGYMALRFTAASPAALPLTIEVRAVDAYQQVVGTPTSQPLVGGDCASYQPYTDYSGVDLSNKDLRNCILPGVKLDPAKLNGTNLTGAELSGATILPGALHGTRLSVSELVDATLVGVDFRDVRGDFGVTLFAPNLRNADLSGANLTGVNLKGARLDGAKLATATLTGVSSGEVTGSPSLPATWAASGGYLVGPGADLHNAFLTGVNLAGAQLTGANLVSTSFSGADLTNADLTGSDASHAGFPGANLSGTKLAGTTLTEVTSGGIVGTPASLPPAWSVTKGWLIGPSALLVNADFTTGADLSGIDLHGRDLTSTGFGGANVTGANFTGANLTNASLFHATVTGAAFAGATLTNVGAYDMTGTASSLPPGWRQISGSFVGPTAFVGDANLSGVSFAGADLHGMQCYTCTTVGTDFTGTNLRGGASDGLAGATLTNADLRDTQLSGDFRNTKIGGANLTGATLTNVDLTGATGTPIYTGVDLSTTTCPDGTAASAHANTCQGHPWP